MSHFFIYANFYANWATAILSFVNVAWILEIIVDSFVERESLNEYVERNWKLPLVFILLFAGLGVLFLFLPQLGLSAYLISIGFIALQTFFMRDYKKMIRNWITPCWFTHSLTISLVLSILSIVAVIVFTFTAIGVSDYGL